jgi:hypothetical protein
MTRFTMLALAAALSLAAARTLQAQGKTAARSGERLPATPVHVPTSTAGTRGILDHRIDLALTAEQIRQLDAIARRYDDQDKLLRDAEARAASRAAERKEVNAVLTEDQRARVRDTTPSAAAEQARK